jgi:hypothetical protein
MKKNNYPSRTLIRGEIVCEFLAPSKPSKKVVIICQGLPGVPCKSDALNYFSKKGFWVFYPRYRGTWESGGLLYNNHPGDDIIDLIHSVKTGFKDSWSGKVHKFNPKQIIIVASSFGGSVVLYPPLLKVADKAAVFSPLVDWSAPSPKEPIGKFEKYLKKGFNSAYRINATKWLLVKSGKLFNPVNYKITDFKNKVLIIHAKDDKITTFNPVKKYCKENDLNLAIQKIGGHLSYTIIIKCKRLEKKVIKFIKNAP